MDSILALIDEPSQLKRLTVPQLEKLARELRELIIDTVAKNGGHLAPSLGVVELTLALYSVLDLPADKIIWDVGHQAYAHKILTGRRDAFVNLRRKGGISGFPKRAESGFDAFGVGHASTSISAALGMAIARDLSGENHKVVAVIGDGALTGGEAFEALNNAGNSGKDIIVVLNDNEMSIDRNVGAVSEYLSRLRIMPQYHRAKKDVEDFLRSIPRFGDKFLQTALSIKDGVRSALMPGGLFEELGFKYIGPLDGHNIALLQETFRNVRDMHGPILVHVHTTKGKGYLPAEMKPDKFHGIGKFNKVNGESEPKGAGQMAAPTYTSVFSQAAIELAAADKRIVAITAAMPAGTGLKSFGENYPRRFFDVGIAEEHAVTLAAGMAAAGLRPLVAIYSTFAQRAYDQMVHDVCLQNLPVVFCLDRAGLVGEDGPTHHGVFDFSYLRHMPNMMVMAPKDENELRHMLKTALKANGPVAVRYPRGAGLGVPLDDELVSLPCGEAEVLQGTGEIALLAIGSMARTATLVAEELARDGLAASVVNMRFLKPLDERLLREYAATKRLLVTLEENVLAGGFGSAVAEFLLDGNMSVPLLRFGLPDKFIGQGTRAELLEECGLLPSQIASRVRDWLATAGKV